MSQFTIRGFGHDLADRIQQPARQGGTSPNQAALKLLPRETGLRDRSDGPDVVGASLDHLIGTWTAEEAAEVNRALEDFSEIDEEM